MIERWFLVILLAFIPMIIGLIVPIEIGIYFGGLGLGIAAIGAVMGVVRIRRDRQREGKLER